MADWWRAWHGLATDPKWTIIARRAKVSRGVALAVGVALLERASEAEERGSIAAYENDVLAEIVGADETKVVAVIAEMVRMRMIVGERFAAWERRQPAREREDDDSLERTRKWRAKKKEKQQDHAPSGAVTHVTPVTPVTPRDAMRRLESESEERRTDSDSDSARERAVEGALAIDDPALKLDSRGLEARCLALVVDCPVVRDPNFGPILRLKAQGFSDEQVVEGVSQALGKMAVPPRSWGAFVAFIERIPKPKGAIVLDLRANGRPPPAKESALARTIRQLEEIRAEDRPALDAGGGLAS